MIERRHLIVTLYLNFLSCFVIQKGCVYCGVRTESLSTLLFKFGLHSVEITEIKMYTNAKSIDVLFLLIYANSFDVLTIYSPTVYSWYKVVINS